MRRFLLSLAVLGVAISAMANERQSPESPNANSRPEARSTAPREISADDVSKWLKGLKPRAGGCGGTKWNGEDWSVYANDYRAVVVPWSKKPVNVTVDFVYGKKKGEHHLIRFSGEGFRFERRDDSPKMHRVEVKE